MAVPGKSHFRVTEQFLAKASSSLFSSVGKPAQNALDKSSEKRKEKQKKEGQKLLERKEFLLLSKVKSRKRLKATWERGVGEERERERERGRT